MTAAVLSLVMVTQRGWTTDDGVTVWEGPPLRRPCSEANRRRIMARDKPTQEDGWWVVPITAADCHHTDPLLGGGGGYHRTRYKWETAT